MARNTKSNASKESNGEKKVEYKRVPKIGTRHMGDARKVLAGKVGDVLVLGTLLGVASDTKRGVSQYGEFMGLKGTFRFFPADGSQPLQSGTAYLPGDATAEIAAKLGDGGTAQFGLKVTAIKTDTRDSPVGYMYVLEPVLEAGDDPLDALMSMVDPKVLALPAPGK